MNTYNIIEKGCVFYHAIANSEERVRELAKENNFNIEGMEIELERENVKNQLGRDYSERIEDALVY